MLIDTSKFEGAVKQCVHVPMTQYEYDSAVDLAYNIGTGEFCKSSVVRKFNAYDYAGACAAISRYVCGPASPAEAAKPGEQCYSANKPERVLPGLVNRRADERAKCEGR